MTMTIILQQCPVCSP